MSFSKTIHIFLGILLFACVSAANATEAKYTEAELANMHPDIARIIQKGELVVATTIADYAPFYWTNSDGKLVGYEPALAQGLADALGVKLRFLRWTDDYSIMHNAVVERKADLVLSTYSQKLERALYLNFSNPYFQPRYGLLVNRKALVQHRIKDNLVDFLQNTPVKIGVLKGSANKKVIKKLFPACEIYEITFVKDGQFASSYDKIVDTVMKGEVFGYFGADIYFAFEYETKDELSLFTKAFSFNDIKDSFVMGLHKEDLGLQAFINIYLDSIGMASRKDVLAPYLKSINTKGGM